MNKLLATTALFLGVCCTSTLWAQTETLVGFDNNNDNKITYESIANGTDDIFLRSASRKEIEHLPTDSVYFEDDAGSDFLALTYDDLSKIDSNHDRRIDSKDPMFAGLFLGRFVPNSREEIIYLSPLSEVGINTLVLPAVVANPSQKQNHLEAVSKDGALVLVQPVPWKF